MSRASTPVGIVTGFLGSGKTTLIQGLLDHPQLANAAVIVNEFGEVSLDHLLVARSSETVVALRNGCICCTIATDLALTLRDLYTKRTLGDVPPFDYVLIETTGLADPGPMLHTLTVNPIFAGRFHPDAVITCVDPIAAVSTLDEHVTAGDQIAIADLIVLTKTDVADAAQRDATLRRIDAINRRAERIEVDRRGVDPDRILRRGVHRPSGGAVGEWLVPTADGVGVHPHGHAPHDHGRDYGTTLLTSAGPLSLAGAIVFFDRLAKGHFGHPLRMKGLAAFVGRGPGPALLHGVRDRLEPMQWLPAWPDADHRSRVVVIGRDLRVDAMRRAFDELCRGPADAPAVAAAASGGPR